MSARKARPYVQFSKRMVVLVVVSAIGICCCGLVACAVGWALDWAGVVEIIKAYIGFATIVFTAYSGNSIAEKWFGSKNKEG